MRLALLVLFAAAEAHAADDRGFSLSVVVGGRARPEYPARNAVYVEALRGAPYALRLTNPLCRRVAVAVAVDGLNTIDARHGSASDARKWVIEPYGSITIPGWQVSGESARSFFFSGEKGSYGAALGRTDDLGVIEAVFFAERAPVAAFEPPAAEMPAPESLRRDAAGAPGGTAKSEALSDDFAATGMGGRRDHPVVEVAMDLEPVPVARVRIRYEFRPQLEALGIGAPGRRPADRREDAAGFADFCPEPGR
jgi:hypothetical protein